MKRKIVIFVSMHSDKDKAKAMMIAVAIQGVISVSIDAENNRLEVIGEGIDSLRLAKSLRKKFRCADIISLEEVPPPPPPIDLEDPDPPPPPIWPSPYCCPPVPPCTPIYYECRAYDAGPPNSCSIM